MILKDEPNQAAAIFVPKVLKAAMAATASSSSSLESISRLDSRKALCNHYPPLLGLMWHYCVACEDPEYDMLTAAHFDISSSIQPC